MSYAALASLRAVVAGALAAGALAFVVGDGKHSEWQAYLTVSTVLAVMLVGLGRRVERRPNQFMLAHKAAFIVAALLVVAALTVALVLLERRGDDRLVGGVFAAIAYGGVALYSAARALSRKVRPGAPG